MSTFHSPVFVIQKNRHLAFLAGLCECCLCTRSMCLHGLPRISHEVLSWLARSTEGCWYAQRFLAPFLSKWQMSFSRFAFCHFGFATSHGIYSSYFWTVQQGSGGSYVAVSGVIDWKLWGRGRSTFFHTGPTCTTWCTCQTYLRNWCDVVRWPAVIRKCWGCFIWRIFLRYRWRGESSAQTAKRSFLEQTLPVLSRVTVLSWLLAFEISWPNPAPAEWSWSIWLHCRRRSCFGCTCAGGEAQIDVCVESSAQLATETASANEIWSLPFLPCCQTALDIQVRSPCWPSGLCVFSILRKGFFEVLCVANDDKATVGTDAEEVSWDTRKSCYEFTSRREGGLAESGSLKKMLPARKCESFFRCNFFFDTSDFRICIFIHIYIYRNTSYITDTHCK